MQVFIFQGPKQASFVIIAIILIVVIPVFAIGVAAIVKISVFMSMATIQMKALILLLNLSHKDYLQGD